MLVFIQVYTYTYINAVLKSLTLAFSPLCFFKTLLLARKIALEIDIKGKLIRKENIKLPNLF